MFIDISRYKDKANDSDMIQAAIDASEISGEAVLIPSINPRTNGRVWNIDKALILPDNCTLILNNCHLRLADGAVCNMFRNKNARTEAALTPEGKQCGITIQGIGRAVLDGGIHNGVYEDNGIARKVVKKSEHSIVDNCMVYFQNVEHLTIDGITVKDQRYWGICLYTVSYSRISNIRFESALNVPNQDGVDLCKGCHNVVVENISGCVGDNIVAMLATDDAIYSKVVKNHRDGDIHDISVRNVIGYGVGGCALVRLLNHDGYRIYNISIDTVIEASPWSDSDAGVAPNPDLMIRTDDNGDIIPWKTMIPGEFGCRTEAAILIGESYWYKNSRAEHGDTFGITVRNVMTHARYALFINNTLLDATFENIRLFGNGFMAAYFGEGQVENIRLRNITYDRDCHPLAEDEHIYIDWNKTRSDGFHCINFTGTRVTNLDIDGMTCTAGETRVENIFGGHGSGCVTVRGLDMGAVPNLSKAIGIDVEIIG